MSTHLRALALATALLAVTSGLAAAQAPYGNYHYGYDGYVSGWGAPPASLPYPACSTYPDFGNSPACSPIGSSMPPPLYGAYGYPGYYGYGWYGYRPGWGWGY